MRNAIQRSHLKLDVLYHTLFLLCGWVKLTIFVQRDFPFINEDSLSDTLVFSAPIFFLSLSLVAVPMSQDLVNQSES